MATLDMNVTTLPWQMLPMSANIDVLHLAAGIRPNIRLTSVRPGADTRAALEAWGQANRIDVASDQKYTWLSTEYRARALLELDQSSGPHEEELGLALGYPPCCCAQVAAIGEANIDAWATQVLQQPVPDRFGPSSIADYHQGTALLSHVPCAATCRSSLEIAHNAANWIRRSAPTPTAPPWPTWQATLAVLLPCGTQV